MAREGCLGIIIEEKSKAMWFKMGHTDRYPSSMMFLLSQRQILRAPARIRKSSLHPCDHLRSRNSKEGFGGDGREWRISNGQTAHLTWLKASTQTVAHPQSQQGGERGEQRTRKGTDVIRAQVGAPLAELEPSPREHRIPATPIQSSWPGKRSGLLQPPGWGPHSGNCWSCVKVSCFSSSS